jgi:hypothetical protein
LNKSLLCDSRGQLNAIFAAAIGIIVLFVTLSLGMVLTANFYVATGKTPAFNDLWPLAIAGIGILTLFILLLKMMQ